MVDCFQGHGVIRCLGSNGLEYKTVSNLDSHVVFDLGQGS